MPSENIFLFVPNLIGECCPRLRAEREGQGSWAGFLICPVSPSSRPKVMPGLSSPSFLSTSCPAAPSRPPPSTCSADFWTLLMDTLLESLIKVTDTSSQPASRPNNPLPPFPASSGTQELCHSHLCRKQSRVACFCSGRDLSSQLRSTL